MTIVKAVKALAEGKKIRRNDWKKGDYITLIDNQVVSQSGWSSGLCIEDFSADWWEEYKGPVLVEEEKEYLSAVIKPFRDRVVYIRKVKAGECNWFISIKVKRYDEEDSNEYIDLPYFRENTMYKNMEVEEEYTLEELGL